jgi:uncharacterized OB-fold protein
MTAAAQTLPGDQVHIATDPVTEPFWQAAKEQRLVAPKCSRCGHFRMPPTPFCPECQSTDVEWVTLSGRATVFSYTVVHGFPGLPEIVLIPVVADLDGAPGARLVTNVIGIAPADVTIGMDLEVAFTPIADGWSLPVFRPAAAG